MIDLDHTLLACLLALVGERLVGYPRFLQQAIAHPVEWVGWLIAGFDRTFNRPDGAPIWQRAKGALMVSFVVLLTLAATVPLAWLARRFEAGAALEAALAWPLLSQASLSRHVNEVAKALERSITDARRAVGKIVGRDVDQLDSADVSRAAIESLAENTADGVIAPALWLIVFGLPGIAVYKAVNTADSMVGYRSWRYRHFGAASARLDDLVNFIPARLTAVLFAAAASLTRPSHGAAALHAAWRHAGKHASPNAGWPEAAMAGAIAVSLGGPRAYKGRVLALPWIGDGKIDLDAADIARALRLYGETLTLSAVLVFFFWLFH